MFQTEVDVGLTEFTPENPLMQALSNYRQRVKEDQNFKPLIKQILQESTRKHIKFENHDDRIMHKYINGLGHFSKKGSTGRRIPP
jgi:hypothetical protein